LKKGGSVAKKEHKGNLTAPEKKKKKEKEKKKKKDKKKEERGQGVGLVFTQNKHLCQETSQCRKK